MLGLPAGAHACRTWDPPCRIYAEAFWRPRLGLPTGICVHRTWASLPGLCGGNMEAYTWALLSALMYAAPGTLLPGLHRGNRVAPAGALGPVQCPAF
ncbi:hypothetical protein NDU88_007961 [Pleurodeles waltl]|uniref:Uncharacterized protein n=1 Tax=Pleurodeles waltl TaxID=8319 RepID=A0AAV7NV39_PLEWA|nr:hypothetical protein NDU88_007961 [Pleurodeles waltl]